MKEVTKEQALHAQKCDRIIKVTSNIYPRGLRFKPWESHTTYFIGHKNIRFWTAK